MKIATVPILLTLALCLIQDAASEDENQETCSEFRVLMKNGKLFCSQDKKLLESSDGIMFLNKCATCKVVLEKEAKTQKRARHLARATRTAAPAKLNCDDFRKGEGDGDFICTPEDAAVCGTDGKTYSSRCVLCAENIKTGSQIGIKNEGECEGGDPEQDVCSAFRPYVRNGRLGCTRENDPVLGPDGRTHGNKCAMCAELFLKEAEERGKHHDETRIRRSAGKDFCKEYENQVRNGRLFCTRESDPIRGPDGRMHGNKCALCAEILKQRFSEERNKAYENLRKAEEKVKVKREIEKLCSEYRGHAQNGILFCTRENDPVRGPDGKMHGNLCSMCQAFYQAEAEEKKKADRRNKREPGKSPSFAELCSEYRNFVRNGKLPCTRENDPILGPDGKMHGNTCSMCEVFFQQEERARAKAKREAAKELCNEYRNQVRNGMLICTKENDPVRGPDGRMHGNKCAMCASVFKLEEEEEKKGNAKDEKEKGEAEKAKREAVQELCSEYRNYLRHGRLPCTRENDPIEGPDGKIHGNTCSMCEAFFQQEAKEKEEAEVRKKVKRDTRKDTCSEFRSLLQNGKLFCTRENDPVRGPDGKTHGNKCAMCKAVFQKEDEERKRKEEENQRIAPQQGSNGGGGAQAQDTCDEFRSQMKNGQLICTRESDPVQGSDGKTHGNKCAMCKEKLEREAAEKKKKEEADKKNTANRSNGTQDQCHEFRKMVTDGKLICTRENDPVRGPDGKMHVNKCAMCQSIFDREARERQRNDEEKSHDKPSSDKDECGNFREYVRNDELLCTREHDPVRGADGKFYKNKCYMCRAVFEKEALQRARLQEKPSHPRSSEEEGSPDSPNSSLNSEMCKHYRVLPKMGYLCPKNLQPVCGEDGQTYNNPCMLCHENLIHQTNTRIRSEGPCEENSTPKTPPVSGPASDK